MSIFLNYLKITLRQLQRERLFFLINVVGLATGLAVAFFAYLFVKNELNYEQMHSKAGRVFRLTMHNQANTYDMHWARVDRDWVNLLPRAFPEVERLVRFQDYDPRTVQSGEDVFKIAHAYSTDKEVFQVFDFELVKGNPRTALAAPRSVVLSESMALRLFRGVDPMGKELIFIDNTGTSKTPHQVTGVMRDLPASTHLPVNLLTSFASEAQRTGWAYTYLLLKQADDAASLRQKLPGFIQQHAPDEAGNIALPLQNLKNIHLQSSLAREIQPNGSMTRVWLFGVAGLFVLLMAAINYINLNMVQSLKKLRETGVRKALGSTRRHLVLYFIASAGLVTFLATLLAFLLVGIFLPWFREFALVAVPWHSLLLPALLTGLAITLLAGYYPAFVLSSAQTLSALKNTASLAIGCQKTSLQHTLVALQLVLCIMLISSAFVTRSQFRYLIQKNTGLQKEQLLAITGVPATVKNSYPALKNRLQQLPKVQGVTSAMEVPSREIRDAGPVMLQGSAVPHEEAPTMDIQVVDHDFIELMGLELLAGRNFSERPINMPSGEADLLTWLQEQKREYIINKTAMKMLGFQEPDQIINQRINWNIGNISLQTGPVVGVVQDFHQESLRNKIEPLVMIREPVWTNNILVKLQGGQTDVALSAIKAQWQQLFPEVPLEYAFVDDMYNRLYETEKKQIKLIYIFSALAVLISFSGIFGLLTYLLKTREKEIAIRKVLGAGLQSLAMLLGRRFLLLMLAGTAVAVPLAWLGMAHWLQSFAYRIDLNGHRFLVALLLVALVLMLLIVAQLGKTALRNPADTLRTE